MRKIGFCLLLIAVSSGCLKEVSDSQSPVDAIAFQSAISQEALKRDLTYFASDVMQGRDTGGNGGG